MAAYLCSNIYESDRIRELKLDTERTGNMSNCRKTILKYLSVSPVDQWVSVADFNNAVKKDDRKFLVREVGDIFSYDSYYRYYGGMSQI